MVVSEDVAGHVHGFVSFKKSFVSGL